MGETASDFLNVNLGFGLTGTSIVAGIILLVALFFQFRAKKYIPGLYWLSIVLISIVGTLVTDNMTDAMGIPLELSTIAFSIALIITFALWFHSEKTLSIHSITTTKREAFYWLTVLFTFALGTAAGDLMAESLGSWLCGDGPHCVRRRPCRVHCLEAEARRRPGILADLHHDAPAGSLAWGLPVSAAKVWWAGAGATITSFVFIGAIILTVIFLSITKIDRIAKPAAKEPDAPKRRISSIQGTASGARVGARGRHRLLFPP